MKIVDAVITLTAAIDANTEDLWGANLKQSDEAVKIKNILVEMDNLEQEAKKLSVEEQVNNDIFVQNMTVAKDRISFLEQSIADVIDQMENRKSAQYDLFLSVLRPLIETKK